MRTGDDDRAEKGAPPAIGAIAARNKFMPVLLSQAFSAAVEPRNSSSLRRGSRARHTRKPRCAAPSQPGKAYSGAAMSATASLSPVTYGYPQVWPKMSPGSRQCAARSGPRVSCLGASTPASSSRAEIAAHSASLPTTVQGKSYIGRTAIGVAPLTPRAHPNLGVSDGRAMSGDSVAPRRNNCCRQGRRCARSGRRD